MKFSQWMCGNFRKYSGHWNDLPVDSHSLKFPDFAANHFPQ